MEIFPFRALRFTEKAGSIKNCVCPPYDIVSQSERAGLAAKNEHNLIRLELPEGENRYEAAGALLREWMDDGILAQDKEEALYVYREEFRVSGKRYALTGFLCRLKLCEFSERVVLPHEETLSKAKQDRFELMKATNCNFSPIYSLYDGAGTGVSEILAKTAGTEPVYRFTDEEAVTHTMWQLTDRREIAAIQAALRGRQAFIADGHHRYETALNYRRHVREEGADVDAGSVMMMLVDMEDKGLVVFPTHRMIVDMPVNTAEVAEKCSEYFDISSSSLINVKRKLATAGKECVFAMYTGDENALVFRLRPEARGLNIDGRSQAYSALDVSVLHKYVLEGTLGIDRENMARQVNLRYTRSAREAVNAVRTGRASAAFIINPTRVSQIKDVALAGDKMPQKSTYFYPKLKTGLVMNIFDKATGEEK